MRKYRERVLSKGIEIIRSKKLQGRFIGIILVATVLPLIISEFIIFIFVTRAFKETNFENIQKELELYSVLIDTKLEEYEGIANEIATSLDTIKIVSFDYGEAKLQNYIELSRYNNRLDKWSSNLKELLTIEVVNDSGIIAYKPYCFINSDPQESELYKRIVQNGNRKVFIGACHPENTQKALIFPDTEDYRNPVLFSTKIKSAYGDNYIGCVNIYIKEALFTNILNKALSYESEKNTFFDLESIFIVDENGTIVMHKDTDKIGESVDLFTKNLITEEGKELSEKKAVEELGGKKFIFSSQSRTSGFYIVSTVDYEMFFSEINGIKNKNIIISVFIILVAVAVSYLHSISIKRPLNQLVKGMNCLEANNFQIQIQDQGKDEVHFVIQKFNEMVTKTHRLMEKNIAAEKERADMELRVLEEQINPHFLYNILDMMNWMAFEKEQEELCRIINALSKFYRLGLNAGKRSHTIYLELEHAKAYIEIQNMRFRGKIEYTFQIDEEILPYKTVKMILQPLLENAIEHGILPKGGKGKIWIRGFRKKEVIYLVVEDNGTGIKGADTTRLFREKSSGYGLYNVDSRIKLAFGQSYGVTLTSREEGGTKAVILIHAEMEDDENENSSD